MTETDLTSAMSADVKLLGGLLGVVIRKQHGEEGFALVERVRATARARRKGDADAEQQLREIIDGLDAASLDVLIKAFSNYFQLINIAEDQQRIRVLRSREARDMLERIHRKRSLTCAPPADAAKMREMLDHLRVRLVVTAHPSEAKRKEVLIKLRRISADGGVEGRAKGGTAARNARPRSQHYRGDQELWQTRPTRASRPKVEDEVDFGLYFHHVGDHGRDYRHLRRFETRWKAATRRKTGRRFHRCCNTRRGLAATATETRT